MKKSIDLTPNLDNLFEYRTGDLYEASYLKAKGFRLIGTDFIDRTVYFIFEGENIESFANSWKFNPSEEIELIKKYNTERESMFGLLKTVKLGGAKW